MDFFIFRHGETANNVRQIWQGYVGNPDINYRGVKYARNLAFALQRKDIEVIVSSPLLRAYHTASIVATHCQVPLLIRENLHEVDYGNAEGMSFSRVKELWPENYKRWHNPIVTDWTDKFENGETMQEALNRILSVLDELSCSHQHERIAIACHGGLIVLLLGYLGVHNPRISNCECIHIRKDLNGNYHLV